MGSPTIIDLFAGAGGLSLGAARAGFKVVSAVENDSRALLTHTVNFPNTLHLNFDIAKLSGDELLETSKINRGKLDGIIGGPPCQGFSVMGKQSLSDSRNDLFMNFFRLVTELKPRFFLAENVPGIMNERFATIRHRAFSLLPKEYILLKPIVVKANEYGAPTTRTRVFFIGYDPKRFHKDITESMFLPTEFADIESVVVKRALRGLPMDIRHFPDSSNIEQIWCAIKKIEHDGYFENQITGRIPDTIGNESLISRYVNSQEVTGCIGTIHSLAVKNRYEKLKFGELDRISKASRLDPNGYCPTLRAGTAPDKGSFQAVRPIHYERPRVITPREAARLQGFPDWFVFHPTKWHSFRQIGNSVSPIVAERLLSVIARALQ